MLPPKKAKAMKNLDLLPLPSEVKERLAKFAQQYLQLAQIAIEVVSFKDNWLIVRVEQKKVNEKQLTRKELIDRVRKMFADEIPPEWRLTVSPVDYCRTDIDNITPEWIKAQMQELGLKTKHLTNQTGIDKHILTALIEGYPELTKWQKIAFYYYFKYHRVRQF